MPDGGDVGIDLAEAIGSMADDLDLVVHALEGAVGDAQLGPAQDAVEMFPDQTSEAPERIESAVAGPPQPLLQIRSRPARAFVVPEPLEGFFQVVGTDDRLVGPTERRQPPLLLVPEVPGVLQPQPAGRLEGSLRLAAQQPPALPAHFVHRPVQVLNHVEAIEDQEGVGQLLPHRGDVPGPRVAADDQDRAGPARPQPGEEAAHRVGVAVLADPDQAVAFEVVDQSQVTLPLAARHLVDADHPQRLPGTMVQAPRHRSLHGGRHGLPVQAEVAGGLLPRQPPRQPSHGRQQSVGDALPARRPGNLLDSNPAEAATDATGAVGQSQRTIPQAQVPPAPFALSMNHTRGASPARAAADPPALDPVDPNQHPVGTLLNLGHHVGFQSEGLSDKSLQAHRCRSSSRRFGSPRRITELPMRLSFTDDSSQTPTTDHFRERNRILRRLTRYPTRSGNLFTGSGKRTSASAPSSSRRTVHEAIVAAVTRNTRAVWARDQLRAARSSRTASRAVGA